MPTVLAQRLVLGASLGLGVLDVAWLDLALAPRVLARTGEPQDIAAQPAVARAAEVTPPRVADVPPPAPAVTEALPPAPAAAGEPAPANDVPSSPRADEPERPAREQIDEQVYFASMRAELDDRARATLDALVHDAPDDATFVLGGHADYRGEEAYNKKLSRRRADAVAGYLAERGIARQRIRIGYLGEEAPHPPDELWRDRRVDIQISRGPR